MMSRGELPSQQAQAQANTTASVAHGSSRLASSAYSSSRRQKRFESRTSRPFLPTSSEEAKDAADLSLRRYMPLFTPHTIPLAVATASSSRSASPRSTRLLDSPSSSSSASDTVAADIDITSTTPMLNLFTSPPKPRIHLFVASLGNPKPYQNTLHSAGHLILQLLVRSNQDYTWSSAPFQKGQIANGKTRVFSLKQAYHKPSTGTELPTLWRCPAVMNVSGPAVKKAWNAWLKERGIVREEAMLVIVHDEMERALGDIKVQNDHRASAKGHNGIKSVQSSLQNEPFIRVGVGIGRPVSRDPETVSAHVLRNFRNNEMEGLEVASKKVWQAISEIEEANIG